MIISKKLSLLLVGLLYIGSVSSQVSDNWFNEDRQTNEVYGVSSDKLYQSLPADNQGNTVVVAVIDGGTDVNHPDLKDHVWVNPGEIAGNGIDDDNNGYVDDINGWNFIGGPSGEVGYDTFEATRIYAKYHDQFDGKSTSGLSSQQLDERKVYERSKDVVEKGILEGKMGLNSFSKIKKQMDELKHEIDAGAITVENIGDYKPDDESMSKMIFAISLALKDGATFDELYREIDETYKYYYGMVYYQYNTEYESRKIVGDNYDDYSEKHYGNNNVTGPEAMHGTHVAGIIGAVRNNDIGIKGVASNVKLMIVRAVPDGDERDKDVANAIRYAVDNGAKVINMSFGKSFSPGKSYVDEAVRYAVAKNVVLVHAAGNDASNNDKVTNYPNPWYKDSGTREPAWIEVGAIAASGQAASFTNYGPKTVDVFAPGVKIYSTAPDGGYVDQNGTSMASPMVAGIAAMLRSYFPSLSAVQVRQIIMDSAVPLKYKTKRPGSQKKKTRFKKLCATGGLANAYEAYQLALQLTR